MDIVNHEGAVAATGICPHCQAKSFFQPVTAIKKKGLYSGVPVQRMIVAVQCQACQEFGLLTAISFTNGGDFDLENFYPQGTPDDSVSDEVPQDVAQDFAEALRCRFIKSHKGCVVMCRRALQSSAIALGAKGGSLIHQIDDLFSSGKITEPLKDFAHEIRLTGNDGAHPDKDGLSDVTPDDSTAIVEFTKEYLHHVYVMPAKLKARQTKPAPTAAGPAPVSQAPAPPQPVK